MKLFAMITALFILTSCGGAPRLEDLNVPHNEAAVIGRIQITYNGTDVTEGSGIFFNEKNLGTYSYLVPKGGWILTRLPLGTNHLERVAAHKGLSGLFHYDFNPRQTSFRVNDSTRVYYIGHINVDWTGDAYKAPYLALGLVGVLIDEASNDGRVILSVEANETEAARKLKERFGSDKAITSALIGSG